MALSIRSQRVVRSVRGAIPPRSLVGNLSTSHRPAEFIPLAEITSAQLDLISTVQGSILYRNATAWVALPPGTSGHFLKTLGAAANPLWAATAASGDPFFDPPLASEFPTSVIDGAATTEDEFTDVTNQGLSFVGTFGAANRSVKRLKTAPSDPFTFTARFNYGWSIDNQTFLVGLVLRESASGRMEFFGPTTAGSAGQHEIRLYRYTNTTQDATVSNSQELSSGFAHLYLRVAVSGGVISYSWSADGRTFHVVTASTVAAHLVTLNQIGFVLLSNSAGTTNRASQMISYELTA